jgi:hypothetical protein
MRRANGRHLTYAHTLEFEADSKFQLSQIAVGPATDGARQSAKVTPFAGGSETDGSKKAPRRLFSNEPGGTRQPAKATPFAGGNEADGLKKAPRRLFSNKKENRFGDGFFGHTS